MSASGGEDHDARLWRIVTATVRPLRRRPAAKPRALAAATATLPPAPPPAPPETRARPTAGPSPRPRAAAPRHPPPPPPIEPGRRRRLERARDEVAATIDLHGLDQDRARAALTAFLLRGWTEHRRAILVITGKGALGDGVLRRRVPEWLAEPPLRQIVAGLSEAHRRHGGEGAIYVALKRASQTAPHTP
ncbi:MAG: mismatch repair protein MutS [Caulobacteraceae bacterium]|nr:mismatch repair protein MutS [Caulobacteraceae bacterium]